MFKPKWSSDKVVTVFVIVIWALLVIIHFAIHTKIKHQEQSILNQENAVFLKNRPRIEETVMSAYHAVLAGNYAEFAKVVDTNQLLFSLNKEFPALTNETFLQAIKDKRFIDTSAPFQIRIQNWALATAQNKQAFFTLKPPNSTTPSAYEVTLHFQAHGYKKSSIELRIEEQHGQFYITAVTALNILQTERKLNTLAQPELWLEAERNAAETLSWTIGKVQFGAAAGPSRGLTVPFEIQALSRNIKLVTFKAQLIDSHTDEIVDSFLIMATPKNADSFKSGTSMSTQGIDSSLDPDALPLLMDGRLRIGKTVPLEAVYEGNGCDSILFSKSLEGI